VERKRYTWKTASVIQTTADAVTITFDTNGPAFEYRARQFVNVSLIINGESVSRSYSLSSSPTLDDMPSITVKGCRVE
jgi:ferredoxin-NADP reductase